MSKVTGQRLCRYKQKGMFIGLFFIQDKFLSWHSVLNLCVILVRQVLPGDELVTVDGTTVRGLDPSEFLS